ncbi:Arc/MetJ family transcription regulator [Streptomyces sp. V4I23]|nr:Arc/MetJ family transcription regulator [Streptomyces sp. V4I23]
MYIMDTWDGVVGMSVTQIDLDDEALTEAMRLMGASTKKETVNAALRDYVARIRRLEAAEKLAARGERGEFEAAAAAHEAAKRARRAAFE